jgi:hypothetical protein
MIFSEIRNNRSFILEMLAIFVGISASFWVDDYRTQLDERALVHKYMNGFIRDLESDLVALDELLEIRKNQDTSARSILLSIESNTLDIDSFYTDYFYLFPFYRFIPNSNTIEELLNSSHLRLVSDETLKNGILELRNMYKGIQLAEEHVYHDRLSYSYSEFTMDKVELQGLFLAADKASFASSKDSDVYRQDAENFLKDRYFKNFLTLLVFNMGFQIPQLEEARDECKSLIEMMNEQLENR